MTLARVCLFHVLDDEGSVALGGFLAHCQRLVVLHCCADVPVVVRDRDQGAVVHPSDVLVEQKSHHVAVWANGSQGFFVFNRLRWEKINVRSFDTAVFRKTKAYLAKGQCVRN